MKKVHKIIIIIVSLCVVIVAGGFGYLYLNGLSGISNNTKPQDGQIKVACVGDSITYGHGISNWPSNNYPAVLQELLGDEYHVANFGSSGSCVNPDGDQPYVERSVYHDSIAYDADILVIMLGTNDSKPENWTDEQTFMEDYMDLLEAYLSGEKMPKVYICLPAEAYYAEDADSELAKFDIQPQIVDEIAKATAEVQFMYNLFGIHTNTQVVDIHSLTEEHPEWFEVDGIHPSAEGAKGIAEMIAEAIFEDAN